MDSGVRGGGFKSHTAACQMILDKLLLFPELQFSYLYNGNSDSPLQDCWESQWNRIRKKPMLSLFLPSSLHLHGYARLQGY